ncbi:Domain of unknown function DUF4243 [Phaffia rhodozyma]|uniref:Uncharacterized protein n=1 Tax=Phaffia rhodozyma TaxID=264483 RepID=A0A0F7SLF0_PHARH|nr:Domain of unknown function DUF4243 [Phaffia rhodozyma]
MRPTTIKQVGKMTSQAALPSSTTTLTRSALPVIFPKYAGRTAKSEATMKDLIEKDGQNHHIFTSNNIFHNHLTHHVLSAWSLGASSSLLKHIYDINATELVPLQPLDRQKALISRGIKVRVDVPEITESNWTEYLGIADAYAAYLAFFLAQTKSLGMKDTLSSYVFGHEANFGKEGTDASKRPVMLVRLMAGAVHPFIQTGFGAEFAFIGPLLFAEGLAEAAVHSVKSVQPIFPSDWPEVPLSEHGGDGAAENVSVLEAYKRLVDDENVVQGDYDPDKMISTRMTDVIKNGNAPLIRKLVSQWTASQPDLSSKKKGNASEAWVERKMDEVMVFAAFIACATGKLGEEPKIDFFLMHILTSSLFLPSFIPLLSAPNQIKLLETYLAAAFQLCMSRGLPKIDGRIPWNRTQWPVRPGNKIGRGREGNGWNEILEEALYVPDSHTVKSIRSLFYLSTKLGTSPAGSLPGSSLSSSLKSQRQDGEEETFPGMGSVDGSIFIRMAGLIMDYMKWNGPEAESASWDRSALGWDEAWK